METLVKDSVNPIEKVERSVLLVSSVVHACDVSALVNEQQLPRVREFSPKIFQ